MLEKEKGTFISGETIPSPSRSITPLFGYSPIFPSTSSVSSTRTVVEAADDDIPLQSLFTISNASGVLAGLNLLVASLEHG